MRMRRKLVIKTTLQTKSFVCLEKQSKPVNECSESTEPDVGSNPTGSTNYHFLMGHRSLGLRIFLDIGHPIHLLQYTLFGFIGIP